MSMTWSWMTVKLHCEQTDGRWEIYAQQEIDVWETTKAEFLQRWMMNSELLGRNPRISEFMGAPIR